MKQKPEQKFWRNRVQPVMKHVAGLTYERVEVRTGKAGIPDVVYNIHDVSGWIELKWSDKVFPIIDLNGWNSDQRRFARNFDTENSPVFLMVGSVHGVFLIRSRYVLNMDEVNVDHPGVKRIWLASRMVPGQLGRVLGLSDER